MYAKFRFLDGYEAQLLADLVGKVSLRRGSITTPAESQRAPATGVSRISGAVAAQASRRRTNAAKATRRPRVRQLRPLWPPLMCDACRCRPLTLAAWRGATTSFVLQERNRVTIEEAEALEGKPTPILLIRPGMDPSGRPGVMYGLSHDRKRVHVKWDSDHHISRVPIEMLDANHPATTRLERSSGRLRLGAQVSARYRGHRGASDALVRPPRRRQPADEGRASAGVVGKGRSSGSSSASEHISTTPKHCLPTHGSKARGRSDSMSACQVGGISSTWRTSTTMRTHSPTT